MIRFTVDHEPIAQPRPRVYRGKAISAVKGDKIHAYKQLAAIAGREAYPHQPFYGACVVRIEFVMSRPKNERGQKNKRRYPCLKKPDIDNMVKAILDALNGVIWVDDNQVYDIHAAKWVAGNGERPRVIVEVETESENQ